MQGKNLANPEISTTKMDTKLNKEKIQALSICQKLESEVGKSTLDSLIDELIREWDVFEKHGNFYANLNTRGRDTVHKYASQAFTEIQCKKLFNLECKWRAGKVKLDIISSHTFDYYYTLIHECPFIEPVTDVELAAYKEYLFELDRHPEYFNANRNHGKMVKAALNNTSDYPKWYTFFDIKFNTRDLLFLDDLIDKNEKRCLQEEFKKYKSSASPGDTAKFAEEYFAIRNSFETGDFSNIVVTTNEKFLELAQFLNDRKYAKQLQIKIDDELSMPEADAEWAYIYLESILHNVPALKQDYTDWKDGLYETAWEHLKIKIIKCLDDIFKEYKTGKLNDYPEERRKKAKKELDYWQGAYLEGKRKLGEK